MENLIKKAISPIQKDLDIFENNLKNIVLSCDNIFQKDLENFMFSNQKRLRPIFTLLFSKILDVDCSKAQEIAVIVELIHSASLIHDDILDESKLRRNNPTFYSKFGSKIAVLEGDFVLALALEELAKTTPEISKVISNRVKLTILGELEQNISLDKETDINQYFKKSFEKTGNIFLMGLEALFSLKDVEEETKENLARFLIHYSTAFQIKNDIKDVEADFKNGNYTLIVLYYLQENNINDFDIKKIDKYKAMAQNVLEEYKNKALYYLDKINNSIYKDIFKELVEITLGV